MTNSEESYLKCHTARQARGFNLRLFCSGVGFVANTGWYRKRLDEAFLADRQIIADQRFSHLLDPRSYSPKSQFVVIGDGIVKDRYSGRAMVSVS